MFDTIFAFLHLGGLLVAVAYAVVSLVRGNASRFALILALLVVQSIWARAKRKKRMPTGQVSNRVFAGTMIIIGAVALLLALYTYATIRRLQEIAMSPPTVSHSLR